MNQAVFLSNDFINIELIKLMTPELIAGGNTVEQLTDEADTITVSAALESALIRKTVNRFWQRQWAHYNATAPLE